MIFPFLKAKDRLIRIMGTFDLATGHADTWDELLDSLESELRDVLGYYREALAQPEQEQNNTYVYASNLAKTIWQKHYMKESPKFALLDTTEGVLTQIDNMTCGLVREKPAQQEPTGMLHIDRLDKWLDASLKERKAQRTWVGLTDEEIDTWNIVGHESLREFVRAIEAKLKEKNT